MFRPTAGGQTEIVLSPAITEAAFKKVAYWLRNWRRRPVKDGCSI